MHVACWVQFVVVAVASGVAIVFSYVLLSTSSLALRMCVSLFACSLFVFVCLFICRLFLCLLSACSISTVLS